MGVILGDPGADSGGEGKSTRAGKYGMKKSKEWRVGPLGTMSYQTSSKWSPPFCLLIGAKNVYFLMYFGLFFFYTSILRIFLVEFVCNMADFHAENTHVMLQCLWLVLYKQLCEETNHRQLWYCMS